MHNVIFEMIDDLFFLFRPNEVRFITLTSYKLILVAFGMRHGQERHISNFTNVAPEGSPAQGFLVSLSWRPPRLVRETMSLRR